MRFTSIYLQNYIGIYNGMGLYEIHIDFSRCRNRITIIRGDNGGGKSTLMKALSLFPDPNDAFIPGLPARKEIVLVDNQTFYKLVFVHGVKSNGDRETTKAYITKTFGDMVVELNENGNVTSFRDIIYSELGLDANFAALSQLSNDDRGLADKKPAERKRFVNSIISSLDTYNAIYKTLTKRSSNYKSMINAVVAKLNVLGDEKTIEENLHIVEAKISNLQILKDDATANLAREQSKIQLLDPDGSIQLTDNKLASEIGLEEAELDRMRAVIIGMREANPAIRVNHDYEGQRQRVINEKNSLIVQNQIDRNTIESLIRQREAESSDLEAKVQKLNSLQSGYSYEHVMDKIAIYRAEIEDIKREISIVGIDIDSVSREEYILALETLRELEELISSFKSGIDYSILENIVNFYLTSGNIPDRRPIKEYEEQKEEIQQFINNNKAAIISMQSRLHLLDTINLRPAECKDDSCPFIHDAVEFSKTDPVNLINAYQADVDDSLIDIRVLDKMIDENDSYNDAVNRFAVIVREVNKHASILSKMPNGDMFRDTRVFFERLLTGYSFEYMKEIYKYIDFANLIDTYRQTSKVLAEYEGELKVYESKSELVSSLIEDIDKINKALEGITERIDPINEVIATREIRIAQLQELEGVLDGVIVQLDKCIDKEMHIKLLQDQRNNIKIKMAEISTSLEFIARMQDDIKRYTFSLGPLMQERDKLVHSVQMMKDYIREKEELESNYEFIEKIKYYSSPTTGIQLVFMELYMGKIISLANNLLSLLFNGQYVIQPFVINESEFRIPCLGSGYLNDDISSMSSSQIGMISMILSFALLHHSSTKYNIIKLDEIDGPLDYNNRMFFTEVLNSIMNIMGTEQCIMISHNTELQVDDFDVILLKHDPNNTDYMRGNIIWSC